MNETLQKWNDEFNILNSDVEPTLFFIIERLS